MGKKRRERVVSDFYTPVLQHAALIFAGSDNMRPTYEDVAVATSVEYANEYMANRDQQIADLVDVLLEDPKFLAAIAHVWDAASEQFWHRGFETAVKIRKLQEKKERKDA